MNPAHSTLRRLVRRPLLSDLYRYLAMAKVLVKSSHFARRYPYRRRGRMLKALGPDLASMTRWSAMDTKLDGATAEVFKRTGPDKLAHYLPVYESVIDRSKAIKMLELGSFYADSLKMWQEYLHPNSLIVSIDVKSQLTKVAGSGNIHVRFGDEESDSFLENWATQFGPFNVILDNGNHTSSQMVDSFRGLFAAALCDNGVYIVEDVDCDYRKAYRDSHISFIDFVGALIDAMHGHYRAASSNAGFRLGHANQPRDGSVPAITPLLGGIEIYDSLVVVRRASRAVT